MKFETNSILSNFFLFSKSTILCYKQHPICYSTHYPTLFAAPADADLAALSPDGRKLVVIQQASEGVVSR